jgi:lipoprotein-releasing system ATP-binding protein
LSGEHRRVHRCMIRTQNISKSFGDLHVLKGIDLIIGDGEIVAIVGASGAGKTTLLQIIGTLSRMDTGEVWYGDIDIRTLKERQLARFRNQNIGFVFQFHHLLPEFTALENVCIPGFIARKSRKKVESRAREILGFLGLSDRLEHKPAELSGGEQQRVAVARALINDPAAILADEPSGNLDSRNKTELHRLFFSLRDQFGQTFVIVTHDKDLAGMSDRMVRLADGKIIG